MKRSVVGLSGASGAVDGIRFLDVLRARPDVETHLVVSEAAKRTIGEETDRVAKDGEALATRRYDSKDFGATFALGSFKTDGMVIAPRSVKAADVTLKEGQPLIMVVRKTPLHLGHMRALTALAEMGAVILPPTPAFDHQPKQIEDLVDHTLARVPDRLGLSQHLVPEWQGTDRCPDPARRS